jgi:hypothetical protein
MKNPVQAHARRNTARYGLFTLQQRRKHRAHIGVAAALRTREHASVTAKIGKMWCK